MAAPTIEFRHIYNSATAAALDTATERLAYTGAGVVSTGVGNELDFGSVDITAGAADSNVEAVWIKVTTWNSNTTINNFRFWLNSNGFDQAGTVLKFKALKLDATSEWIASATAGSYTMATLPESEPSQNVYRANDGSTDNITSATEDTTQAITMYVSVATGETLGEYKGTTSGYEFQYRFKFDYY